jgi:hypothetical protein
MLRRPENAGGTLRGDAEGFGQGARRMGVDLTANGHGEAVAHGRDEADADGIHRGEVGVGALDERLARSAPAADEEQELGVASEGVLARDHHGAVGGEQGALGTPTGSRAAAVGAVPTSRKDTPMTAATQARSAIVVRGSATRRARRGIDGG